MGKMPEKDPSTGTWIFPASTDVLEAAGLHTISHYIQVRRQTIAAFIVDRPIFDMCRSGGRRRGSSNRQFWWEQPFDLEAARFLALAKAGVAIVEEDGEELENP